MSKVWDRDQVELILKAVLIRLETKPTDLKIKREGTEVKISAYQDHKIYITLDEKDSRRIYISLDGHSDIYRCENTHWWWQKDKNEEIKVLFDKLISLVPNSVPLAREALLKCFPEVIDMELEKAILIDKIPSK